MLIFDVITVGSATLDIFLSISQKNKHFRLNKKTNELCVKFGDKAIVDKAEFLAGGNAGNVAVGLSRMNFKTAIAAEVGCDEFTQKIVNVLKKEGVSEILLKQKQNTPCPFSIILNFKKERTIFCEDVERKHIFNFENVSTKWVYLTSVGKSWEEAYKRTLLFVKTTGAKLAFNPGTLQIDSGQVHIRETLSQTDVLFINKEEGIRISGFKSERQDSKKDEMKKLLINLKKLGPKAVVATDGPNGSFLIDEQNEFFFQKTSKIKPVEKTGAGDAFGSGFLSAVLQGKTLKEAMEWGSLNSESVILKVGAQSGLLKREEMLKKL